MNWLAASVGCLTFSEPWRVGTTVSRKLGPDWRVFGFARVDHLAGAANRASPLVRRDAGLTAGIGASYTWLRSGTLVDD